MPSTRWHLLQSRGRRKLWLRKRCSFVLCVCACFFLSAFCACFTLARGFNICPLGLYLFSCVWEGKKVASKKTKNEIFPQKREEAFIIFERQETKVILFLHSFGLKKEKPRCIKDLTMEKLFRMQRWQHFSCAMEKFLFFSSDMDLHSVSH